MTEERMQYLYRRIYQSSHLTKVKLLNTHSCCLNLGFLKFIIVTHLEKFFASLLLELQIVGSCYHFTVGYGAGREVILDPRTSCLHRIPRLH